MNKNCGIYKITNPSGKVYIGQSSNIRKRKNSYRILNCKQQGRLFNSFKKYGFDNHVFEVIHLCDKEDLNKWEIYYGEFFNCLNPDVGLNIKKLGYYGKHTEESRRKIGLIHKGKKLSQAQKEAVSLANKGKIVSDETKHKLKESSTRLSKEISKRNTGAGNGMWGKKHSEETRAKIGAKSKGRIPTENARKLTSIRMKNYVLTEESRQKISNSKKKIILNIETGIFYIGVEEAAMYSRYSIHNLYSKLNGNLKNNTSFINT